MKKKFYKKWQFWVGTIVIVAILGAFGNSNSDSDKPQGEVNTGSNQEENQKPEDQKKDYAPKEIAEFNMVYRSATNKDNMGMNATINISSIEKREGNLVINIGAPTIEQINYAFDEFLYVLPMDIEGKELSLDKITLNPIGGDIEAELVVTGVDAEKVKWVEIGPYKINDKNPVVFTVE